MSILRIPVTIEIDLAQLSDLIRELDLKSNHAEPGVPGDDREVDLPRSWKQVEVRHGVTYRWGDDIDRYEPFIVYEGTLSGGETVRLAIGKCDRARTFGEDRVYYIVMAIGPSGGIRAISEFLATDDYDESHEVIAIVKGKDGTGRQFDDPTELPSVYDRWRTLVYRDRVDYPGAYRKQALVCDEGDFETMLNHSLTQIRLRRL